MTSTEIGTIIGAAVISLIGGLGGAKYALRNTPSEDGQFVTKELCLERFNNMLGKIDDIKVGVDGVKIDIKALNGIVNKLDGTVEALNTTIKNGGK